MSLAGYSAFLFIDVCTDRTHIAAWDPELREWSVPCGNIDRPHRDGVTYTPTKPLCLACARMTQQADDRPVRRHAGG